MPVALEKACLSDAELDRIDRLRGQGKTASKIVAATNRSLETRLSFGSRSAPENTFLKNKY